jgi:hypothetical protein
VRAYVRVNTVRALKDCSGDGEFAPRRTAASYDAGGVKRAAQPPRDVRHHAAVARAIDWPDPPCGEDGGSVTIFGVVDLLGCAREAEVAYLDEDQEPCRGGRSGW